jgi:hypothetical protein
VDGSNRGNLHSKFGDKRTICDKVIVKILKILKDPSSRTRTWQPSVLILRGLCLLVNITSQTSKMVSGDYSYMTLQCRVESDRKSDHSDSGAVITLTIRFNSTKLKFARFFQS